MYYFLRHSLLENISSRVGLCVDVFGLSRSLFTKTVIRKGGRVKKGSGGNGGDQVRAPVVFR